MIEPNRLVIGNITTGEEGYAKPFFINNDSFPQIDNALCWRQSVTKKPGSELIGRLARNFMSVTLAQKTTAGITTTIVDILNDSNINQRTTQPNAAVKPGTLFFSSGASTWNDATTAGILTATGGTSANGTIDYATGEVVLHFTAPDTGGNNIVVTFGYYPGLPVLGIEDFESDDSPTSVIDFPVNVFFDQRFSYQYDGTNFYDVSFYKVTGLPVTWSGANYQQFFSCNYYRAMFVTNNNPGFNFVTGTYISGSGGTVLTFNFSSSGTFVLKVNDWLFFNEWPTGSTINGASGQITVITPGTPIVYTVTFTTAVTASLTGIAQLMTNSISGAGDGIRWYDGNGSDFFGKSLGWVNFAPPLDNNENNTTTYLMGAKILIVFGSRLLAIGTYEGTSTQGAAGAVYYGNRIRYCEVFSTPFYASPTPNTGTSFVIGYVPLAWASNVQGFGGSIDLDTTERIISAAITQGVVILGLESEQRRMSNTGVETDPFSFEVINPEYGSAGTYGVIPMDKGILTVGEYGFLMTSSYDSQRFDQKIIDRVFSINANKNGFDRICGARDFYHEVVYFTYLSIDGNPNNIYPNRTVVYNYRENSFALWKETFSTYGLYKVSTTQTWSNYFTPWEFWVEEWQNLGGDQYVEPYVAGGTPQGFILAKWADQTYNHPSLFIQAISGVKITSANHNLETGMYVGFWPSVPSDTASLPSFIYAVTTVIDQNNFQVGPLADLSSVIPGIWLMSVVDQINIYTKQFQAAWSQSLKTRIGAQKYFLDTTTDGEFTLNIYGSQSSFALTGLFNSLAIFTGIVRTKPDDSLGLNDSAYAQTQTWHRLSSSAIGDTVQLQFTMSQFQMLNVEVACSPWVLYSVILDLYPSRALA